MAFYTVVTGWIVYYFVQFLTGNSQNLGFSAMLADPGVNVTYLAGTVARAFGVLCGGLQSGLERVTKYMMLLLLLLRLVLAVHSFTLDGAAEGLRFYLVPDLSRITGSVAVGAMNQAFFTLSVGMGAMAIFGSYIGKERSLMGESGNIILLDTFVAIVAGLIMFPACFTYGVEVNAGPSLLFDTMATVFNHMNGGRWWGTLFVLFMVFAALSTVQAVCEEILAMVRDLTGWSRPVGCLVCGGCIFLVALTTALGYSVLHFQPFAEGTSWLDLWDFLVSNNNLPLGSLVFALFCGWNCPQPEKHPPNLSMIPLLVTLTAVTRVARRFASACGTHSFFQCLLQWLLGFSASPAFYAAWAATSACTAAVDCTVRGHTGQRPRCPCSV